MKRDLTGVLLLSRHRDMATFQFLFPHSRRGRSYSPLTVCPCRFSPLLLLRLRVLGQPLFRLGLARRTVRTTQHIQCPLFTSSVVGGGGGGRKQVGLVEKRHNERSARTRTMIVVSCFFSLALFLIMTVYVDVPTRAAVAVKGQHAHIASYIYI